MINVVESDSHYETAKKLASITAVNDYLKSDLRIGLGTGSTSYYVAEHISSLLFARKVHNLTFYPTSLEANRVAHQMKLPVGDINDIDYIDITFDGCDECDDSLNLIKGGGGCHLQEKVIASISNFYVVVADSTKCVNKLGQNWKKGIAIEVMRFCVDLVSRRIVKKLGGTASVRSAGKAKCGPVVTDNGNFIIDWVFPYGDALRNWEDVEFQLRSIPGVVGTGLFIGMANVAVFADLNGKVWKLKRSDILNNIV